MQRLRGQAAILPPQGREWSPEFKVSEQEHHRPGFKKKKKPRALTKGLELSLRVMRSI